MENTDLKKSSVSASRTAESEANLTGKPPTRSRPMQKGRFVFGMLLSACGLASMLIVAAGALQSAGVNGRLSLPIVALFMVLGLMLLGGGFGVMATSAGTFDDDEFNRLMADTAAERDPEMVSQKPIELPAFRGETSPQKSTVLNRAKQTVA